MHTLGHLLRAGDAANETGHKRLDIDVTHDTASLIHADDSSLLQEDDEEEMSTSDLTRSSETQLFLNPGMTYFALLRGTDYAKQNMLNEHIRDP